MIYRYKKDLRKCIGIRLVRVHPVHAAEFGFRIDFSKQSSGFRFQFWRWEVLAYVKYGLYEHEVPGTDSYLRMNLYKGKQNADGD